MSTSGLVEYVRERAAAIASQGNGLPHEDFTTLAEHLLSNLAGYRCLNSPGIVQQDTDYLARTLQALSEWMVE